MAISILRSSIARTLCTLPAPDRACSKTSERLFSTPLLERAPSNDHFWKLHSPLDGALSKTSVEITRSEVLYQARSGAVSMSILSYLSSRMTRIDERRSLEFHVRSLSEGDGVGRTRVESLITEIV